MFRVVLTVINLSDGVFNRFLNFEDEGRLRLRKHYFFTLFMFLLFRMKMFNEATKQNTTNVLYKNHVLSFIDS